MFQMLKHIVSIVNEGVNNQVIPGAKSLACQFKRHHPLFYIDPLREEVLYHDPLLVVYHDIMNDKEIARIKDIAIPKVMFELFLMVMW